MGIQTTFAGANTTPLTMGNISIPSKRGHPPINQPGVYSSWVNITSPCVVEGVSGLQRGEPLGSGGGVCGADGQEGHGPSGEELGRGVVPGRGSSALRKERNKIGPIVFCCCFFNYRFVCGQNWRDLVYLSFCFFACTRAIFSFSFFFFGKLTHVRAAIEIHVCEGGPFVHGAGCP